MQKGCKRIHTLQDARAPAERVASLLREGCGAVTGLQRGADSPRGSLAARASPAPLSPLKRRPRAWAQPPPAPRARPQTPPPPPHGRSDLPARGPASPVIHVRHTPHEGKGGGWTTKPTEGSRRACRGGREAAGRAGDVSPGVGGGRAGAGRRRGVRGGRRGRAGRGRRAPKRSARPRPPPQPGDGPVTHPPGSCGLRPGCLGRRPPGPGSAPTSRAGGRAGGLGAPDSPRPFSPPSPPAPPAAETCAEPGPRRPGGGRADNGCSAASGGRGGRMRRGGGGGHAEPAGLGPGPGMRRLRGDGGSASG